MSETVYHRYRLKRRTTAGWAANNEVLLAGEPGIEVLVDGTEKIKYGDGVKTWAQLSYAAGGGGGASLSNATPQALGTAAAGSSAEASRADHRHQMPTAGQVGADASGTAAAAVAAHAAAADPHPGYALESDGRFSDPRTPTAHKSTHATGGTDALSPADIGAATAAQGAKADTAVQPGGLTKAAVGLANVDNTSDADKPVSTATATALAGKAATGAIGSSGLTMATARLLGRTTVGAGAVEEIQVAGGTFANGVLTLSGLPSTLTADANGNLTFTARWIQSTNGAASAPPMTLTGTWFTGGMATTTKPQFLIEPAGTTSASWSTAGTGLGVNAASGFGGDLAWLGVNGVLYGKISAGTKNIFLGEGAGMQVTNYTGIVALGQNACGSVTTAGTSIVAIGVQAFRYLNVANGSTEATAVGPLAGGRIVAAGASVLLGGYAGQGSANFSAQIQRTTCAGFEAGAGFNATTLADNSLFGYRAGFAISSGNQNTFLGSGAGSTVTTGSNNIAIGFNAAVDSITASNQINIGGVYYHDRIEGSKRFTGNVGFYTATPVAQPAAVADATDAASVITQLNLALARLRTLGLIAT